jgi:hypothetical protein
MHLKLSEDQRRALCDDPNGHVLIEDEHTRKQYVIVEQGWHEQALKALQQQDDLTAIQGGIDDMEAGRFVALDEADAEIRRKLGFTPRTV